MISGDHSSHLDTDDLIVRLRSVFAGRYEIERELRGGGMSRVFVAIELSLGRRVVIKILPPGLVVELNRERFKREIQFAAKLQHPHIVPLYTAGEEGDLLYYTMPFIAGAALTTVEGERRQMAVGDVVDIMRDVTSALAYAHREGVVHRDIKPANVLMADGHAVVTDFGVAKAVATALPATSFPLPSNPTVTTTGHVIGTPAYMAPEQLAGDPAADHRVDIYALGLLVYELLTGRRPFRGPSPQAMLAAQFTGIAEPITEYRADVPPIFAALVTRCLEKDAGRRPRSAEAVLEVLRTIDLVSGSGPVRRGLLPTRRASLATTIVAGVALLGWGGFVAGKRMVEADSRRAVEDSVAVSARRLAARTDSQRLAAQVAAAEQRVRERLRDSLRREAGRVDQARRDSIRRDSLVKDSIHRAQLANDAARFAAAPTIGATPEAFVARRNNMGPPRRVAVLVSADIRSPDAVVAAVAVREAIGRIIRSTARYLLVPLDSAAEVYARTRNQDTLVTRLAAELFVVILTTPIGAAGDTLGWNVRARDQSAERSYQERYSPRTGGYVRAPVTGTPDLARLTQDILRGLDEMDRAPRRTR